MFTSPTHIYIVNRETTTGPGSGDVHHTNLGLFWTIAEANACARAQIPGLSPSDGDEDNRRLWPEWYTKDEDGGICIKNIRSTDTSISTVYVKRHPIPPIPIPVEPAVLKMPVVGALEEISAFIDHKLKEGGIEDWFVPKT